MMGIAPVPSAFDRDLYAKLQVHPRAHPDVIEAAYKALLKQHMPRTSGARDTIATDLGEAHSYLHDAKDRRRYDDYRRSKNAGLGPYKIIKRVAEGGFGVTYKAEHSVVGDYSCIKQCHELSVTAEEVLKQETKAIWNLRHYGIPTMRDILTLDDGSLALVMSWIEGPTLAQIIEKHGRLDAEHVGWITERIINTLSYLHHHGVLHGDIKPQNIIVQPDTHVVVLVDFGLAAVKPTASFSARGYTEIFSPPEQVGGKPLLPGSDFYSLGMTMLYALSGEYRRVQARQIPTSVPAAMEQFIYSLIKQNVLERPERADKLFQEISTVRHKSFGREHSGMKPFPTM
jgi:serine/threonine protein kinase